MFTNFIELYQYLILILKQSCRNSVSIDFKRMAQRLFWRSFFHLNPIGLIFLFFFISIKVEIARGYTSVEWREDLKTILRKTTEGDMPGVFLFTDTQIKQESFLEDLNNLLNAGEVPNLFPLDERQEICEKMRLIDK